MWLKLIQKIEDNVDQTMKLTHSSHGNSCQLQLSNLVFRQVFKQWKFTHLLE